MLELEVLCLHSETDELYVVFPMHILAACHPVDLLAACQHPYLFTYTTHISRKGNFSMFLQISQACINILSNLCKTWMNPDRNYLHVNIFLLFFQ